MNLVILWDWVIQMFKVLWCILSIATGTQIPSAFQLMTDKEFRNYMVISVWDVNFDIKNYQQRDRFCHTLHWEVPYSANSPLIWMAYSQHKVLFNIRVSKFRPRQHNSLYTSHLPFLESESNGVSILQQKLMELEILADYGFPTHQCLAEINEDDILLTFYYWVVPCFAKQAIEVSRTTCWMRDCSM